MLARGSRRRLWVLASSLRVETRIRPGVAAYVTSDSCGRPSFLIVARVPRFEAATTFHRSSDMTATLGRHWARHLVGQPGRILDDVTVGADLRTGKVGLFWH